MKTNQQSVQELFIKKQEILDNTKQVLKSEFFGIDHIIDQVITNISSWFFMPELQEKPIVINLWGLTGVGKTSLINRLVELIDFENTYYRFDLGKKSGELSFQSSISELCVNKETLPVIITLDEIQHSRTINETGEEIKKDENRLIWELIDSGKIQHIKWVAGLWRFEDTINTLTHLLKSEIKIKNGIVTHGQELYCKEMHIEYDKEITYYFYPENQYHLILEFSKNSLGLNLLKDVKKYILSLSPNDLLVFLTKLLNQTKRPTVKSFKQSIIFILGNIDEAYTMSNNYSADIDADEFHKLSLDITIPEIKSALKKRFRNEQIARLGNVHLIYPALSKASFKMIIKNELTKYASELNKKFNIQFDFKTSIYTTLYNEGVYPTQGVRPVFTTIEQIIKSNMTLFLTELFIKNIKSDKLSFSISENKLTCDYYLNDTKILSKDTKIVTALNDVRQSSKDDNQAITAVHESGHAILVMALLKTVPNQVYSVTSDAHNNGFMYYKIDWNYISKKEIINRVAVMLGGLVAEEIIFGKENATSGSSSDIEKATIFLSEMYKEHGLGDIPMTYGATRNTNRYVNHNIDTVEELIKTTLIKAKQLAKITLTNEKTLLLHLSDYLSDNNMISKAELQVFSAKYLNSKVNFIKNGNLLFYRKKLKEQLENNSNFETINVIPQLGYSLNSDKK